MKKIILLGYWINFLYYREWIFLTVTIRRKLRGHVLTFSDSKYFQFNNDGWRKDWQLPGEADNNISGLLSRFGSNRKVEFYLRFSWRNRFRIYVIAPWLCGALILGVVEKPGLKMHWVVFISSPLRKAIQNRKVKWWSKVLRSTHNGVVIANPLPTELPNG